MAVFDTGPNVKTMDFNAGDIGYVKKSLGHYIENVGDTDMVFVAVFTASRYEEVSPVGLADAHATGIGRPAPERRRGDNREVAGRRPRPDAKIVDCHVKHSAISAAEVAIFKPGCRGK
jgi:hypothetical protein